MSSTPESEYDEWFEMTHNGTGELELEGDVDECVEDRFDDREIDEI
jgi:hypothetical protein